MASRWTAFPSRSGCSMRCAELTLGPAVSRSAALAVLMLPLIVLPTGCSNSAVDGCEPSLRQQGLSLATTYWPDVTAFRSARSRDDGRVRLRDELIRIGAYCKGGTIYDAAGKEVHFCLMS